MTLSNKNGRVVLINLFYEEIVDFIGHEFAHVWYNHRQYLQENESLAKAKAKEWGFNPDFGFTPRK